MADPVPNPEAYPRLRIALEHWWKRHHIPRTLPGWRWLLVGVLALIAFSLVVLPYLLPLGGPAVVHPATLADPNGAFVQVDGESLYYTHLPGSGEPVILIHGFGGSTVTWRDAMPALAAAGYDVYAVDLLGFGLSEKGFRHDYSHPAQAARVVGLMDALGIERAAIVGHSMGGNVAAHLALTYPDRISQLVLVDAAVLPEAQMTSVPGFLFDLPFARRWAQLVLRRALVSMSGDLILDAAYNDALITPDLIETYERTMHTPEWDLGLLGIMRDVGKNALPAPVSAVHAPTLILWGAEDRWVAPGDGAELERLIPGAKRIEFQNAGHLPMHEAPEAFNAALLDFLNQTP